MRQFPLFPSYIFLCERDDLPRRTILKERGVVRFVEFGGKEASVSADVINSLRELESADGLIHVGTDYDVNRRKWSRHQRIEITAGPLRGNFGLFQGMTGSQRCQLLLNFLGGDRAVDVWADHCQAAA